MTDVLYKSLAPLAIRGHGFGKSSSGGTAAPDSLFSKSTIRLIGLLGEGEVGGVVGGLKGVFRNEVPIENSDGTLNFKGITFDTRTGTPDQEYMAGFPGTESEQQIGVVVRQSTPVLASMSDPSVDRFRVTVYVPALFRQKSDGSVRVNEVRYAIEARYYNGPWSRIGDYTISGKTSSGYYRQHEFPAPQNPSGESAPWQLRVIRISADDQPYNDSQDKYTVQSELVFYSATSLIDTKFTYPRSALLGLTASTSQLGDSLGNFRVLMDGIKMPVPSNRDSASRTYSGIWDGTFKEEVCDNPAWFLNLLLTNDTFGLGEFIDQPGVDKISLYEIGRYCDQYVSDGSGGREPRFTFNAEITEQQEAYDLLQLVAQIYRGMVYWGSGVVTSTQDRPGPVDLQVVPESVTEDGFKYSSSARKARHTVAMITWHDPTNYYKETVEFVESREGIARYGYNPTKIDLLGCTSRGQAHRAGLWALLTELYETQVVNYKAGLDHAMVRPGDIIAVQDPQISNLDYSGRLLPTLDKSILLLDRAITLKSGVDYIVTVTMPDGVIAERGIRSVSSDNRGRSILSLENPMEVLPDLAAIWQISGDIVPQLFRVISCREEEPHVYAVTALQHEPSKFAAVDDGATFVPTEFSDFPNVVLPPKFLQVREGQYFENQIPRQSLTLSWQAGQPFNSVGYFVTIVMPDGSIITRPRTPSTSTDLLDAPQGTYKFIVVAIGLGGQPSLPSEVEFTSSGWGGIAAPTVTDLSVRGGGLVFQGRSATMVWTNRYPEGQDPYPTTNYVNVFDIGTGAILHSEVLPVGQTQWTYDYDVNVNENGPRRSFRVAVGAFAVSGEAGLPTSVAVSNPAPPAVVFNLISVGNSAFVSIYPSEDLDLDGYLVWFSKTRGDTLGASGTMLDIGKTTTTFIPVTEGTRVFVRAAAYDAFSKNPAGLNIAAEQEVYVSGGLFDTTAPAIPAAPTLVNLPITKTADGKVSATVRATWPASTSPNFGSFDIRARLRGNGDWTGNNAGQELAYTFENLPLNTQLEVQIRAVNASGFGVSGWSPTASIFTSKNDVAPAGVTNPIAEGGVLRAFLRWTNPADYDLSRIRILYASSPTGTMTELAVVPAPGNTYQDTSFASSGDRYYWFETYNSSDIKGPLVGPVRAISTLVQAGQLEAKAVDATKFADNIDYIPLVDVLPTGAPAAGAPQKVTLKSDRRLYQWTPSVNRWTPVIVGLGENGSLTASQIEGIDLSNFSGTLSKETIAKITNLTQDQIAQLDFAKMAGTLPAGTISTIDVSKLQGTINQLGLKIAAANIGGTTPFDKIQGTQLANLDAALINLGTIKSTQIGPNEIKTGNIATNAINAGHISSRSILTSKLAIASSNRLYNADLVNGLSGFTLQGASDGGAVSAVMMGAGSFWSPDGFRALNHNAESRTPAAGGFSDILVRGVDASSTSQDYPVAPGAVYEFTSAVSVHRCVAQVYIMWLDANKAALAESIRYSGPIGSNDPVIPQGATGGTVDKFPRIGLFGTAPAGAAFARLYLRMVFNGAASPYVFWSALMFAPSSVEQASAHAAAKALGGNEFSPYVDPGVTTIEGGNIRTRSIRADRIEVASLIAEFIGVNQLKAVNIEAGAIKALAVGTNTLDAINITARAITATKLDTESVTTRALAATAVTASKLSIGSMFANIVRNGDMEEPKYNPTTGLPYGNGEALPAGWRGEYRPGGIAYRETNALGRSGEWVLTLNKATSDANGSAVVTAEDYIPIDGDSTYSFSALTYIHNATTPGVFIRVFVYKQDKTFITYYETSQTKVYPAGFNNLDMQLRTHSEARYAIVQLFNWQNSTSQYVSFDGVSLRKASGATLIEDGAVITEKLAANAVTAKNLAAESVTARALLIADTSNAVLNGDFNEGKVGSEVASIAGWTFVSSYGINATIEGPLGAGDPGGKFRLRSRMREVAGSNWIAVQPGDVVAASCMVYNERAGASCVLYVVPIDAAGTGLPGHEIARTTTISSWVRLEGKSPAIPANATHYRIQLVCDRTDNDNSQASYWSHVQARRAAGGSLIVDGAIKANHIDTNSISAAIISAGLVKANILQANSIGADILSVGLNTGNLFWNSDFAIDGYAALTSNIAGASIPVRSDFAVSGLKSVCMYAPGRPANNSIFYLDFSQIDSLGNKTYLIPVQGSKTYEFSAYLSTHRMSAQAQFYAWNGSTYTQGFFGNTIGPNGASGAPNSTWRSGVIGTVPADTTHVLLRVAHNGFTDNEVYTFVSGLYLGITKTGAAFSEYAPSSRTIIDGGAISARTVNAIQIKTASLLTEHFATNTLDAKVINTDTLKSKIVDTDLLRAERIYVGTTGQQLASVINGTSSVKIEGGAISANSIDVGKLKVGSRGIQTIGIEFEIERNSNGNLTNILKWTAGFILYMDENSTPQYRDISAGRVSIDSGKWNVYWYIGRTYFEAGKDNDGAIRSDRNFVYMASVTGTLGLAVFYGGTIIDGTKITTRSIRAEQIAVNSLKAELIESGTVFSQRLYLGSGAISLEGDNHRMVFNNWENTQTRIVLGDVSPWFGGNKRMGMIIWDESGRVMLSSVGGIEAARISGGISGSQLAGGSGSSNLLFNASGDLGYTGWFVYSNTGVQNQGVDFPFPFNLLGGHTFYVEGANGDPGAFYDFCSRTSSGGRFPVKANQRYEASAYVVTHRSNMEIFIGFFDGNGNAVGYAGSGQTGPQNGNAASLSEYRRISTFGTAPSNALYMELFIRMSSIGQSSPYMFITQPYLGEALPNQTELSAWSPGPQPTKITPGNASTYIASAAIGDAQVGSLSANKISVTQLSAFSANMGSITAGTMSSNDGKFVIDLNNRRIVISD